MGSLFFDNESREKQTKNAIADSTLNSFLEFYASYLLDNKIVDSKEECFSQVGKLVSDSMDRGECSVATMERLKKFISEYAIKTERSMQRESFAELLHQIFYERGCAPSTELRVELVDKLAKYKSICDAKRELEQELYTDLKKPVKDLLSEYVNGHKSSIKAELLFLQ